MSNKFISHLPELELIVNRQIANALEICGGKAETYSKEECPVDTGRLRNSIGHAVIKDDTAIIGTNVEYAPYVELGTGIYYNGGSGGRQTPWAYDSKEGKVGTRGQRPKYFLKKAIANHADEYKRILKDALMGR